MKLTLPLFLIAVGVAVYLVVAQPVAGPWWVYADADGTYTGSSLNIAAGGHTKYFDHPGLPLQEAGAIGFAVWHAVDEVTGSPGSMHAFSGHMLLNLDRARPLYRGIAIVIYLLGVAAAFFVAARALGHPIWGLAGALLWLSSPGLAAMSIEFRPDVLLSWLVLVGGYLIVAGYERRDPVRMLGAAVLIGFSVMVKLHAVGLLPPLLLASLLAGPFPGWRSRIVSGLRVHRRPLLAAAGVWAIIVVYFDSSRLDWHLNKKGLALLLVGIVLAYAWVRLGAAARTTRRIASAAASGFNGVLVAGFIVGLAIPFVVIFADGVQSLVWVADAVLGRGVNQNVAHFTDWNAMRHFPLLEAVIVYVLAGIATLIGAARRDWSPLLWFVGSTLMTLLAIERLGATHYFAPGYALAIVPALSLVRRVPVGAPIVGLALAVALVVPQVQHARDARDQSDGYVSAGQVVERTLGTRLRDRQVAVTSPDVLLPDTLYNRFVEIYVRWTPPYPYRTIPETQEAEWAASVIDLHPAIFLTPTPLTTAGETTSVGDYAVRSTRLPSVGTYFAYRIVSGPGVDLPSPSAPPGAPMLSP